MSVSIVIPCYNGEAFVADAVESALAQTHGDCEVIVVDDGSRDGTLAVLARFADRIRVLTGPNAGGAAARNRGIREARGAHIQFLDADDLLHPQKVAVCLDATETCLEYVIPVTDWRYRSMGRGTPDAACRFSTESNDGIAAALSQWLAVEAPLHRRDALLAIGGFREHLACSQENDLHLRLVAAGYRFLRVPFDGVWVRQTAGSVSSDNRRVLIQRREVLSHLAGLLECQEAVSDWRRPLADALTRDAFDLCNLVGYGAARGNLALAERLEPRSKGRGSLTAPLPRLLAYGLGLAAGARVYAVVKAAVSALSGPPARAAR